MAVLYGYTVTSHPEEPAVKNAMKEVLRQHYRPTVNRQPGWLRRVWLWF